MSLNFCHKWCTFSPQQFFIALRLVACAQNGLEVALKSLNVAVPPPKFVILNSTLQHIFTFFTCHSSERNTWLYISKSCIGLLTYFFDLPAWHKQPTVSRRSWWHSLGCQGEATLFQVNNFFLYLHSVFFYSKQYVFHRWQCILWMHLWINCLLCFRTHKMSEKLSEFQ